MAKRNEKGKELYSKSPRRKFKIASLIGVAVGVAGMLLGALQISWGGAFLFIGFMGALACFFLSARYCSNCGTGKPVEVDGTRQVKTHISTDTEGKVGTYEHSKFSRRCSICGNEYTTATAPRRLP